MGFADDLIKNKKKLEEQMSGNSGSSFADTLIANKQLMNQASTIGTLDNVNGVAPTIDANTITNQLTNAVKQTTPILPQKDNMNLGQKLGYVGESFGSGILGGATQMINAPSQNVQEGAEIAQNKTTAQNLQSLLYKNMLPGSLGRIPDVINGLNAIAADPNMGGWKKALNMALEIANGYSFAGKLEDVGQLYGFAQQLLNRNGAKDIQQTRDILQTPSKALQKDVAKKEENLSGGWKLAGQVGQATGNMIPSIGLSLLTGDPSSASAQALSLASMGVSTKGQATEEALNKGANLSEANRIGAAKGLVEVGTEKLTGGLSWFGKGPADQIAEKIINDNVKNSIANFALKKIIGGLGEVGEEVISDITGIAIDKATTDPNASLKSYFKNGDFWNTVITTLLTTGILETGYDVAGKAMTGKSAYQINKEELGRIVKVQDMVNEEISNTDTSKMSNKEINELKSQLETKYTNMLEQGVRDIISQADEEAFYQGKRTGGSELQEVEQQDIEDTANAVNLEESPNNIEENIEENIQEENATTPTATELELNLENQTQNQTQNNINVTTGLEDYIKNNNLTELTQQNIDDYINQILEEQQANLTEQERKPLIDEYQDIIKNYAKDNGIPVIESPKIEIPDMTAESKAPSKAIGRETRNEIKNQVNAFNNAVKSDQYKVGNQVKEQYKNLEQKSINKLDNDALKYNLLAQDNLKARKTQETSARREYVQPVVQRKADVSTTIGQSYAKTSDNYAIANAGNKKTKLNKQKLINDFKKLTGDSKLVADAKMGNYAVQKIRGNNVEAPYSKEAMDLYELIENSKKTSSYLYHSTPIDRIASIVKNGLKVGSKQNQQGVSSTDKLYLSGSEELARSFTPNEEVTLRIKPSANLKNLDYDLLGGEGSYTITNDIDPKYLQVKENGKWVNLLDSKYAKVENNQDIEYNKDDPDFIGLIAAEPKIEKYAKYSMLKEWLDMPVKELDRVSKMLSQDSINKKNQGLKQSEYNDVDGKTVYKYNITNDAYNFSVQGIYKYTNEMEENYENYVEQNNGSTISNESKRQRNKLNSDVLLSNKEQSTANDKLFRKKFEEWNNKRTNNKTSNKNKRELDNSSFSLAELDNETITDNRGEYKGFYNYAKSFTKNNNELQNELLFKHYSQNFEMPISNNETRFYHGTDATYDYDGLKTMDFDEQTMDRNYGDYFYITTDKSNANIYGKQIAEFIVPNNKILSLDEYRKEIKNGKTEDELFDKYWAIEMPDNEYIVKDTKPLIDYSKQKAQEYIDKREQEASKKTPKNPVTDSVKAMNLEKQIKPIEEKEKPKKDRDNLAETKKDEVLQLKTDKGKKINLKKTSDNIYERVETPKKTDVMPNMSNDTVTIGDKKVSNFYSNITEKSKFITEENRETLKDNENLKYYDAITNKDTLLDAMGKLDANAEQQIGDFFAKDSFNAEDMATGWILIKRYQDAGNYEAMSNVIETMREKGTKSGQAIQMLGMLDRLTPEGMEFYAQRQLDNAYNKFVENKSKKEIDKYAQDFTLTPEEHQFIKDTMEKVEKMTNEDDKKVEVAKIVKMLSDKLPPEKGSRVKAWMRISMLGNPKTQVRNVAGNAIIQPLNWLGDTVASRIDKIMSKKTGIRTKGDTDFGALAGGFVKGAKEAVRDAKLGIDTRDINLNRFEENIGAKPFYEGHKSKVLNAGAKILNKTNQILGNVMSGGDRVFYQAIYDNSLKNQMKLNNVTTPTPEMMQIAEQEALSRTWNDSNEYTNAVLKIRNAMNKLNVKGYGLGDVLVPFAKTPANITKAIVDYSPIGLASSILKDGKNFKNSLENGQYNAQLQHKFADSLGKGFAGTILWTAAYALAKAGITSGASDDDKDVANFMRNTLGIQPYSVKIGDKSFTYDWAQPIAAPFAMMADIETQKKKTKDAMDLLSYIKIAGNTGLNILLDQSFLKSIQDVFNNYDGPAAAIEQQIQDLPARATPTFFKQIADLIDPVQRQTYVKGNTGETIKNKIQVKIPGASKELTAQRDTLGREIKKYGGDDNIAQYAFNVFLNPANTNKGKPSAAAEEIYDVYKNTGDKTVMPRQVGYSENVGGTTIPLSAEERNEWQRLSGEKIEDSVKALTSNPKYNSMSYEDKADVINGIVNYSFAKAKSDMFGTQISTQYKTASKREAEGIPIADYYVDRISKRK